MNDTDLPNSSSIAGSKLMEVMASFSKIELREILKFLRSPFFNQRNDVVLLFEYLAASMSDSTLSLDKVSVHKQVYQGQDYDEKQLRYTVSFLFQQLKSYLTQKEIMADPIQNQLLTIKALRKRSLQRVFESEWQQGKKALDAQLLRNSDTHFLQYNLYHEQLLHTLSKTRTAAPGFEEISKELSQFFIANILHQSCVALSYQTVSKLDFLPAILPHVLQHLAEHDYSEVPAIQVYHCCFLMLKGVEPLANFQTLRNNIQRFQGHFPKSELKDIHLLALNFCIKKVNEGSIPFRKEAFELYKSGLDSGVFLEDKHLSRFTYKNIVAIGLGLNEFEWVKQFIESFKPFLEKKYRESTYNFNLALYHFKRAEYTEAMTLLQRVGTDDVLNNMNARRMLLRIYYDLGETEALQSLLDSFQTYIYRKKDLGYQRDLYLNLIRFTRKLLNIEPKDTTANQQLRQEIAATERVAEKEWLMEKLVK
ncbi:MAG: hypothetical protein IT258_10400 [Saprospiraceae bacterium]|nr:hypothetical protein [Saprospiraceae bacterium]